jgi:succinate dehydrogenase hydrophobic anchor subunit
MRKSQWANGGNFANESPSGSKTVQQTGAILVTSEVMEPLSPNDPLHTLLGRARPVEPRPDFTQNVMRAVRQVPQSLGYWERVQAWFGGWTMQRMALAGAAVAVIVGGLVIFATQQHEAQFSAVVQQVQTPAMQAQSQQVPVQSPIYHVSAAMILAATAEVTPSPVAAAGSEDVSPMGLLVQEDSSALTDSELALLVY